MAKENETPRCLPLQSLEEMTDNFSVDREIGCGSYGKVYLGVHKDGLKIAVKILHDNMPELSDALFNKEFYNIASLQHQNIVRLVGYCHETRREYLPYNEKMVLADVTKRALCFPFMENGSLDNYLSDESNGHCWSRRYTIIKGICNGLKYLHEELKPPVFHLDLKPGNILLDENMIPKIADFGLSRLFRDERSYITGSSIGTIGYLPPEFINHNIISDKLDIFSLGVIITKIIAGPTGHSKCAEMSSDQFIKIVHGNWMNRLQATSGDLFDSCSEQVKRCIEIALSCLEADRRKRPTIGVIVNMLNETETLQADQGPVIDQMNSCMKEIERISIHPLQLDFSFRPYKLISCPIDVTNNMGDRHVAVRFVQKFLEGRSYYTNLSQLKGVVPPRSTHTFVVTMETQQEPPDNMDVLAIVVQSGLVDGSADSDNDSDLHEVTLSAVCATTREMMTSETIRREVKIISFEHSGKETSSMDVHPTKPWILAGNYEGFVSIWNYETQARVVKLKINCAASVRFIARKQMFVVGEGGYVDDGYIHVYTCVTMKELQTFKAHEGSVDSLAVHPTQPLVLSASSDNLIKLWNWDEGWECIRTFNGHSKWVVDVKFNPHDVYTFASASNDRTVKIWSIFSPDPVTTLYCPEKQCGVDYYPTGGDRMHYMVTTSWDGTARIWDLQTETWVREIRGLQPSYGRNVPVNVIDCRRGHPVLVTVSPDNGVSLRDSTTYRTESTVYFGLGDVRQYAYIKGIRSLAIAHDQGISIMGID